METLKVLSLFFKIPEFGKVKTRLANEVGEEGALKIYEELLKEVVKTCEAFSEENEVILFAFYYGSQFEKLSQFFNFSSKWRFLPQVGKNFGERLKRAGELLLSLGFERIVFLGGDSPLVDKSYLKSAFDALEKFPLVIGPSRDGGYVLIGFNSSMKGRLSELFDDLPFGGEHLLQETLKRFSEKEFFLLKPLFDIDTLRDFKDYLKSKKGILTNPIFRLNLRKKLI